MISLTPKGVAPNLVRSATSNRVCRRFVPEAGGMMDAAACAVVAGVLSAGAAAARQVPRRARVSTRRTRPSSGWKLLKKLPLLQLPQPVLPTVLVQPDEPVTLVDCGSGSTRALFYRDDGMSHVSWEKSTWRGDPLAVALGDDLKLESLLSLLKRELPSSGRVLLGATAGVRQAMQDGALPHERLELFRDRLNVVFGNRARFMVLSGQEEARAEWEALQHALDFAPDLQQDLFDGMLSGGGMSCQLARRGSGHGPSSPELFSFRNGVLQPGGLPDKASRSEIFGETLQEELDSIQSMTETLIMDLPRAMDGNFALVEWLGLYVAGESTERDLVMGLGYNRWLTHQEVSMAVSRHLAQLHQEHFGAQAVAISRRTAISWVYGIILQKILKVCFEPTAQFYCLKNINWSTGHYLMHKEIVEEKEMKELLLQPS